MRVYAAVQGCQPVRRLLPPFEGARDRRERQGHRHDAHQASRPQEDPLPGVPPIQGSGKCPVALQVRPQELPFIRDEDICFCLFKKMMECKVHQLWLVL